MDSRRTFLKKLGVGMVGASMLPLYSCEAERAIQWKPNPLSAKAGSPNLLFILADQWRGSALEFLGQETVETPNLNALADGGVYFKNAISSPALCTPYRSMLLTGRFPLSTGMVTNTQMGLDLELHEDEYCLGDALKDQGYNTAYIGKWHLDMPSRNKLEITQDGALWADAYTPPGKRRHGFDFWYAYNTGVEHFRQNYWMDEYRGFNAKEWSVDHETKVALKLIENSTPENPFAIFLSWNPPHPPYVAPDDYMEKYRGRNVKQSPNFVSDEETLEKQVGYYGAISSCDDNVGLLIKALRDKGLLENTLVVFTSDHGEMMGSHGLFGKNVWYEESIKIPLIMSWKGKLQPLQSETFINPADMIPTMFGIMGLNIPESVEGIDVSNNLSNPGSRNSVPIFRFGNPGKILAVGTEPTPGTQRSFELAQKGFDWKQGGYRGIRTHEHTFVCEKHLDDFKRFTLYNIQEDPYQKNPLVDNDIPANLFDDLKEELDSWLKYTRDPFTI